VDLIAVLIDPIALGVAMGLLVGKAVGISLFTWLAVTTGLGRLPDGTTWRQIVGLGALGGIGFTVSLFITNLAFTDQQMADVARVGIFAGSLLAGIVGSMVLLRAEPRTERPA
jgi:NhaA family Na+:H+ antiporter